MLIKSLNETAQEIIKNNQGGYDFKIRVYVGGKNATDFYF